MTITERLRELADGIDANGAAAVEATQLREAANRIDELESRLHSIFTALESGQDEEAFALSDFFEQTNH